MLSKVQAFWLCMQVWQLLAERALLHESSNLCLFSLGLISEETMFPAVKPSSKCWTRDPLHNAGANPPRSRHWRGRFQLLWIGEQWKQCWCRAGLGLRDHYQGQVQSGPSWCCRFPFVYALKELSIWRPQPSVQPYQPSVQPSEPSFRPSLGPPSVRSASCLRNGEDGRHGLWPKHLFPR